jgi:hypothetical protein
MQTWRFLLAASAVIFIIGVVLQFFFIGLALVRLGGSGDASLHINWGYWLPILPLLTLILSWPARAGGRTALLVAVLFVNTFVQGVLPQFRDGVPVLAALHPVNAVIILGLGVVVARRAIALARTVEPATAAGSPAPATPQS